MTRRQRLVVNLFELVALWGIAIVQPLLGVFGASPETFIANGITPSTILPIVIAFCVLPPLVLWLAELVVVKSDRATKLLHRGFLAVFLAIFFDQTLKISFGVRGAFLLAGVAALAGLGLVAFHKLSFVGQWFRFLSVTPILAVALFAINTPSGRYALNSSGTVVGNVTTDGSSVAFVMFDEFPMDTVINADGSIDKARFPNFYRLSQISTWYRNYSTVAEATVYAVPAALSGEIPDFTKGATVADHPHNLFTWLGNAYKMHVSEVVTNLCPRGTCQNTTVRSTPSFAARIRALGRDAYKVIRQRLHPTEEISVATSISGAVLDNADHSSPSSAGASDRPNELTMPARERLARTRAQSDRWDAWLKGIESEGCPCLNFIHMLLPHHPWVFYPDGTAYLTTDPVTTKDETTWENLVRHQRLALQAQYADTLIGQLLDALESKNLLDTTQIVVTADHGFSVEDGYPRRFITDDYGNYASILYPPLFIHTPGQQDGVISDQNVESVDLMTLVANGIKSTWPWKTDGMLPADRTGEKLSKKVLYFQPGNSLLASRPDKTFTVDSSTGQQELFRSAFSPTSTADYLGPLYAPTPYAILRGSTVPSGTTGCSCTVTFSKDTKDSYPTLYVSGVVAGNVRAGDWIALAVDGKISGLSPVYERAGELRVLALLKTEDFAAANSIVSAYLIADNGQTLRSAIVQ